MHFPNIIFLIPPAVTQYESILQNLSNQWQIISREVVVNQHNLGIFQLTSPDENVYILVSVITYAIQCTDYIQYVFEKHIWSFIEMKRS